ncbi:MAG: hypothetical protein JOZ01_05930 [Candidatus Eremiobacteraeota bacterium]|nr:hypothetical protein [Candidatus Eremiobacteraeota bacterium]
MPRLVVGVDAGGSRTIAAVACDDDVVRTFVADGANPNLYGIDAAVRAIGAAIEGALKDDVAKAIVVGSAGAGRVDVAAKIAEGLRGRFPAIPIAVTHDAHIALLAAVPSGDAIVLIAGTGSLAYGDVKGRQARAGGGGYALDDAGSGYAIGAAALRRLLRAHEGRAPRDPLLDALAKHTSATNAAELVAYVYSDAPIARIANVAPIVLEFAGNGDRGAVKIVQEAARELFELVQTVIRALDATESALPLAFSGGLLRQNSMLTYLIETRTAAEFPYLRVVKNSAEPYMGALHEAHQLLTHG